MHPLLLLRPLLLLAALLLGLTPSDAAAQRAAGPDEALYDGLAFRHLGPYRGGRSAAVTGVPGEPLRFYMGATGGGVWRTDDGGQRWTNLSDGFFGGSIGAVAVSEWDPNVIYVGGGEKTVRGNVSHGSGLWKSVDAGKTWTQRGLTDSRHIARVRIHPKNPDLVYAAVMGHLFGPSEQRGVYRSKDGGASWQRVLFANADAGAVDLVMDPANPRVLYASTWRIRRTPYSLESGGPGSALWRTTDGGDTWEEVTGQDNGLPRGTLGIIGITISPADPDRLWAIIEADEGGVFRSDDDGATWQRINDDRSLRQRAWYYTRLYADPQDADKVYVLNVGFWRSKDGGKTYDRIGTPHGDHHDLWIDPENPRRMVIGDDGGAQVTFDGGDNWSTYHNQPTAQFYRVTTDNHFPYRIYGAQQDNSTVRILHRSAGSGLDDDDWEPTAGGESGWIAPHPENPDLVFGGSYGGYLQMVNHATGERRAVNVWPDNPMGHGAEGMKYRFQWNFPIVYSRYKDPAVDDYPLYAAGNVLFRSVDNGASWQAMSPDLTRADSAKLGPSGGPITKDNTGVEYYATIFSLAESPHAQGVLWAGSDDGLIHVTRDGGATWQDVTPPRSLMPEWTQVNEIVAHPFEPGGAYVAGTRYKSDDFRPYLFKTVDYGRTWTKITAGIDPQHFTRTIEPDPARRGLLYAGTEAGLYVSFDDGASWRSFQLNLPIVPITDLTIKDHDLIVATQGRSFWMLDDLTPLHQLSADVAAAGHHLFAPRDAYRMPGRAPATPPQGMGENAPAGAVFSYVFAEAPDSAAVKLRVLDADGTIIRSFSPKAKERDARMPVAAGLNRLAWDLSYPDAEDFPGLIMWAGRLSGPDAVPGRYQVRLIVGDDSTTAPFHVRQDPRSSASPADLEAQFSFLTDVRDQLTETHRAIKRLRDVRTQVKDLLGRLGDAAQAEAVREAGKALTTRLTEIEETLYQTKNQSRQDPLNFPIRLNNKLAAVAGIAAVGDFRPTAQAYAVKAELTQQIDAQLAALDALLRTDLPAFNALVRAQEVPAVYVELPPAHPAMEGAQE